jgi:hypothetical protein
MYYVLKRKPDTAFEVVKVLFFTYETVKQHNYQVKGKWGRKDYAQYWCDFYNDKINMETLKGFLDQH